MSEPNTRLTPGMQIGDYHLQELLFEDASTRSWNANQISVSREVIIDSLNRAVHDDDALVATFLSDVRTKAKVDHPLIGSVFEAVREEGICFYAREKLSGVTLEQMQQSGEQLTPEKVVHVIKQVAEANLFLEGHRVASLPLAPDQIFVSSTGMCRLVNMAVGGERDYAVSTQDKHMLGSIFADLLKMDEPGATRTKSLLGYMADMEREIPLTWDQIRELSDGVERQLNEPAENLDLQSHTMALKKKAFSKRAVMGMGIALGVLIAGGLATLFITREKPERKRELKGEVAVATGRYVTHDGNKSHVRAFVIDSHEVTIAEYAEFLEKMVQLGEKVDSYQHDNQPDYKDSHEPEDWDAMYKAAKTGGVWNNMKMSLNCPVVGVDWWDAFAYASYNGRRLPTQEEWYAAIATSGSKPRDIKSSSWGPVDQETGDVTKSKIYGLGGNVSEWTLKMTKPTHDPTATRKMPVICGASYAGTSTGSGEGAAHREWIRPDESISDPRDVRRATLGFRTVAQPEQ